jgi:perosamine synthetase
MYNIPLSRPSITTAEAQAAYDVVMSGQLAQGKKVAEFEERMAEYVGVKHCIAVSNGTAGLFLCLKACGIGERDEVITTPYTFIATTNSILWAGAKPAFVDIDRDTYNIDSTKVEQLIQSDLCYSYTAKAILPVDIFGVPCSTNELQYGNGFGESCHIILDSCESLGSKISRPFDCAVYAFYPNKVMTTGEGGMICTNNSDIADYCRAARNQGRIHGDTALQSSIMGYNFRLTDIQAAIGIEQLKRIDEILKKRAMVWYRYFHWLKHNEFIRFQQFPPIDGLMVSPFVFTIEVPNRDKVMQYLSDHGIENRAYFPMATDMPHIKALGYNSDDYPIAKEVSSRTMAIPFFADMTESEVDEVCRQLNNALIETNI